MEGFVRALGDVGLDGAHLMLAGPDVLRVSDDPEGAEVLDECREAWHRLPGAVRRRVHLASIPMDDVDENAIIVNALQRHAAVVVQKSLAEGFGLTVTEAMWKGRPVVASRLGGIQDQIVDGRTASWWTIPPTSMSSHESCAARSRMRDSRIDWAPRRMLASWRSTSAIVISSSTSISSPHWWVAPTSE